VAAEESAPPAVRGRLVDLFVSASAVCLSAPVAAEFGLVLCCLFLSSSAALSRRCVGSWWRHVGEETAFSFLLFF
jgi:hypothetical protein